jgi:hypothetical protein
MHLGLGHQHTFSKYRTVTLVLTNNYSTGKELRTTPNVLNTQQITSKIYQLVTKNDRMSIRNNKPSYPRSKQELAS